uniref:Uncharacterized protein n=1 Tax=Quercus lobata TaxID=97700 RepID=A0A7N2LQK4_QUELO
MVLCRPCLIISVPHCSRSSSFSKSSLSSPNSVDKQKGIFIEDDVAGPSSSNQLFDDETPNLTKQGSSHGRSRSQYFCFGALGLSVKTPISRQRQEPLIGTGRAPLPSNSSNKEFQQGRARYVADSIEQALLFPYMEELWNLKKHEVFLTLKRNLVVKETSASLTLQMRDLGREFCYQVWAKALNAAGVDSSSKLRDPSKIVYPSALSGEASSSAPAASSTEPTSQTAPEKKSHDKGHWRKGTRLGSKKKNSRG